MTTVQEFKCIFCKEEFDDKEALQIHFRKHGDPQFNQSKTKTRPQYVAQTSGEQSKDGNEMVGCDVCSEVFPTISKAITHKHKVHPDHDAKYFCPWCGKLFTMKHLYNKHLQTSHENKEENVDRPFHCDCCEVDFYVPMAMLYHNKFFHRQDTDIPAFGHSKKLTMHNQEVLQIYYCSFCGEEYVNKVNLHKHTIDDHSDENQSPDEVLRCPLCDAIFYHLDAYEVHLTFHSVEDLYSEKNELMKDITEFSLEAVPPSTEKVENCEPQQDAETTMAEMTFEEILELAASQSSEQSLKKSKKHKKHKKSKKSAITLDEFLNMNKDVFGEGLDFQGVEEVPTRAITKRLKVNKKAKMPGLKAIPELDKLRKQGIIVKKKSGDGIITKPLKVAQNILVDKSKCNTKGDTKLSTSNEVLSKLLSQSNNEIQIMKKGSQDNNLNLCEVIFKEGTEELPATVYENENMECDSTKKELGETVIESGIPKEMEANSHKSYNTSLDHSDCSEKNTSQDSQDISTSKTECPSSSNNNSKVTKLNDVMNEPDFVTNKNNENHTIVQSGTIASLELPKSEVTSKMTQKTININTSDSEANSNIRDRCGIEFDTNFEEFCEKTESTTKLDKHIGHSTSEPLSALKHLSHLITVKPVHQTKNAMEDKVIGNNKYVCVKKIESTGKASIESCVTSTDSYKNINDDSLVSESTLGTLKNLGKNITLKCLSKKNNDMKTKSTGFNESDFEDDDYENQLLDSSPSIKELCGSTTKSTDISENVSTDILKRQSPTKSTNYTEDLLLQKEIMNKDKDSDKTSSQLLKHLTSITAKPLNITKKVNKVTPQWSSSKNISRTAQTVETNQDDIEILNIDDSDSDDMDNINQKIYCKTLVKPDSSRNLNKNVIVKSRNPQMLDNSKNVTIKNPSKEVSYGEPQNSEINSYVYQNKSVPTSPNTSLVSQKSTNEKNVAIKNALKALGKNITVKSRNSSPIHVVKQQEQILENNDIEHNDADSDTDSCSGRVKITEINENYDSDQEIKQIQTNQNVKVEMPDDSGSENETNTNMNEDSDDLESDFEANIKLNRLKKPDPNVQSFNNVVNINKNITVKTLNDNTSREQISKSIQSTDNSQSSSHITVKSVKQNRTDSQDNNSNSNIGLVVGQNLSMNSVNQKSASSSNQVNKEVTVKTFQTQTKTVIQEITTTVTKTIKTVNQTVKEESQSSCQSKPVPMVPQKIQGIRVNQKPKNFQGVTVRHAISPGMGPPIRNSTLLRPVGNNVIRASNQLVPVSAPRQPNQIPRPGTNVTRPNTPRMSGPQKIRPTTVGNTQSLKVGKLLKVSPSTVMSPNNKRPNSDESAGPFSCFKRSKESLIPVSEIPTFNKNDDSKMEYTSSMQMSKSNFMSAVKTVKGNTVVTTTQMKSEMSASSQQFNKLSNMSGLRVMKTSQNKQVQETVENSAMNQTTLEAIEKLQKQGLLIKKPRLDHSEESGNSDAGDDNMDYNSNDGNND